MTNVTRRGAFGSAAGLAALAATGVASARAEAPAAAHPAPASGQITADEALELLKAGNAEFLTDAPFRKGETRAHRLEIAAGQHPFAVLIGCSDSRVSPELLFGRGLGELFIVRVAGNTVGPTALGSIEYAISHLGVPLVVVLGHERCGAVAAAVDVVEKNATFPGHIGEMVEPIVPAVLKAKGSPGDLLNNAVAENVHRVVRSIVAVSPTIKGSAEAGKVRVVGSVYDLDEGHVTFFDS